MPSQKVTPEDVLKGFINGGGTAYAFNIAIGKFNQLLSASSLRTKAQILEIVEKNIKWAEEGYKKEKTWSGRADDWEGMLDILSKLKNEIENM